MDFEENPYPRKQSLLVDKPTILLGNNDLMRSVIKHILVLFYNVIPVSATADRAESISLRESLELSIPSFTQISFTP